MDPLTLQTIANVAPAIPLAVALFLFYRRNLSVAWIFAGLSALLLIANLAYFALSNLHEGARLWDVIADASSFLLIGTFAALATGPVVLLDLALRKLWRPLPIVLGCLICAGFALALGLS